MSASPLPEPDAWWCADRKLRRVLTEVGAARWWVTPNDWLGGRAPITAWESGDEDAVIMLIDGYLSGSFA